MKKSLALILVFTMALCAMLILTGFDSVSVANAETAANVATAEFINTSDDGSAIFYTHYETQSMESLSVAKASGEKTYVAGRLVYEYKDSHDNIVKAPLRNIKVVLWDKDLAIDDRIAETYTNDNGDYYFAFKNGHGIFERKDDVYIRFFAMGETYNVLNFSNYSALTHATNIINGDPFDFGFTYSIDEEVRYNVDTGSTTIINAVLPYNENNKVYKAFSIAQALSAAQNFAKTIGNVNISGKVYVYYPFDPDVIVDDIATAVENTIKAIVSLFDEGFDASGLLDDLRNIEALKDYTSFCYYRFMFLRENYCNDYEGVMHEYSHFLEWQMDTYGINTKLKFWKHFTGHRGSEDSIAEKGKEFGMELAWSEGWASAFAAMSLKYNSHLHSVPNVNYYLTSNREYTLYDYTHFSCDKNAGEAQEGNIIALLIDLYCPYEGKTSDVTLGYSEFFRTSAKKGICTTHDFALNLDKEYPLLRGKIGERLGYYRIAPSEIEISNDYNTHIAPVITWIGNGSERNPNNIFEIAIYNDQGEKVWTTGQIQRDNLMNFHSQVNCTNEGKICYRCKYSYEFSPIEWHDILTVFSAQNSKMNFAVSGYVNTFVDRDILSDYYYKTGPYTSKYYTLDKYVGVKIDGNLYYTISNDNPKSTTLIGISGLVSSTLDNINIPNQLGGYTVESIGDEAFKGCTNLKNATIPTSITSIGVNAFYNTAIWNDTDTGLVCLGNWVVGYKGGTDNLIVLPSDICGISDATFKGASISSILLNDSISYIGKEAFINCYSLAEIVIPKNVISIGTRAFKDCLLLKSILLCGEYPPTIGENVFDNEAAGRKICVPGFVKSKYLSLKALEEYTDDIISIVSHIVFENENLENLTVEYGQDISLPIPTRLGYIFGGWYYKNDVTKICPQNLCWLEYNDTALCAKWDIINYQLNFDLIYDNAIMNKKPASYTIEDNETLPIASCNGYTFKGWYDNPEYIGSSITKLNGKTGNIKLYARWEANPYQITFNLNAQDAKCDITKTTVKFGKTVKLPLPTRPGYYFDGWYRNSECKGDALFDKDVNWNIPNDTTLYAKWTLEEYKIKVTVYENNKAVLKWWNEKGLSNQEVSIKYGVAVSFYSFFRNYFETTGYRQGYICDSFNSQVKAFNNGQWSNVPDLGDNNSTVVVTPVWVLETHSISFSGGGGEISKTLYEGNYGSTITYPTYKRKGYNFKGWKIINSPFISDANSPYYVGKMFNDKTLPDLTPKSVGAGNITLEAQWEIKTFTILFNSNGGSSHNKISVLFNEKLTKLPVPTKPGYTFDGWYTDNGFKGKKYTNGVVWSEDTNGVVAPTYTLYAKWVITTYTISFDSNGGPSVKSINYTIESSTFELPIIVNDGMENIGWINTNKTTEVLTRIEKGRTGNLNLKARWLSSESVKINNNDYHLYNRQVLLDFSTLSTTIINSTYVIDSSVERIALKGVSTKTYTKLRFVIADRSTPLTMTLVNFKFTAPDDQNAIYAQDATSATLSKINGSYCMEISGKCELNLVSKGTCIIKGGTRTAYLFADASNPAKFCSAIVCDKLNILQENTSTLYIYGGNGKNGISSSVEAEGLDQSPRDGKNGGSAIWSCYVKINISNLYVYGGNGGNGAIGLIGSTGASGNLDHPNGYEGGIGQTGGNGGSGRYAFNVSRNITIDSTSKVYAYGGKGGNGGKGGTGGTGGVGRNGDVKKLKPGTGGTGGTGGKGGNKGTGYNAINSTPTISGTFSIKSQGAKGIAGLGGNGGAGGRGGKKAVGNKYGSSGSTGAQGESGT